MLAKMSSTSHKQQFNCLSKNKIYLRSFDVLYEKLTMAKLLSWTEKRFCIASKTTQVN